MYFLQCLQTRMSSLRSKNTKSIHTRIQRARKYDYMHNIETRDTLVDQIASIFSLQIFDKIVPILDAKMGLQAFCYNSTFILWLYIQFTIRFRWCWFAAMFCLWLNRRWNRTEKNKLNLRNSCFKIRDLANLNECL